MNRIVIHQTDGSVEKGSTSDFRPNRETFHLHRDDGEIETIAIADLKAVFFVKDLVGRPEHQDRYEDSVPGGGRKVQVTFRDGEVIVGFTTAYSRERLGWFLVPADNEGNNLRAFIVNAAVEEVEFPT